MSDEQTECVGCGDPLPDPVMCSISHTISPGQKLCIKCGQRETMDIAWASGVRTGWLRHEAALEGMRKAKEL